MNVADVEASWNGDKLYTRLDLAKDAISHFVNSNPHNRYSLVIFAGEAIATLPLTQDHQVFLNLLQNVDYRNLTKQWSDFIQALESGVKRFFPDDFPGKALVFLSDGWDTDSEIEEEKILQIYKKNQNIFFLVLWIWTDIWGKIITNKDVFWRTEYQKYQWKYVLSSINEKSLMLIAQWLKSKYLHVTQVQDIWQIDDFFWEVEKKSFSKSMQNNEIIINRNLIWFSFIFFILYYFLHIFEMPLYYLIFQGYKK